MKGLIADYDGVEQYLAECNMIASNAKKIVLFGSAKGAEKVWDFLNKHGLDSKIVSVLDNDASKQGKLFHGIKIYQASYAVDIVKSHNDIIFIIASGAAHIIKRQLLDMGIEKEIIKLFVFTNLQTNPTPYEYYSRHIEEIQRLYQLLNDERSRQIFIGLINYKITMDASFLEGLSDSEGEQYFDSVMKYSGEEYFVDCGAYIGDTLDIYASKFDCCWKKYYCFEADENVFKRLMYHVEEKGYKNIELFNVGCWSKRETLYFNTRGSGSSVIEDNGKISIEADSLDSLLLGKNVSIIKMDIEGAEKEALIGAKNIIKEQHPRLAISIYHSLEDFIKIPLLMSELGGAKGISYILDIIGS